MCRSYIKIVTFRGCHATWCWRGFEGVVDSSRVLTASGFGYLENQSFELTPYNVTATTFRMMENLIYSKVMY